MQVKVIIDLEAYKLQVDSLGFEQQAELHDWVEIGVYGNDSEKLIYLEKVFFDKNDLVFSFEVNELPEKVVIDPRRLLIEKVREDNVLKM